MAIHEKVKDGKKIGYAVQVSTYHPITKKRHFRRGQAKNKWEAQELERTLLQELKDSFSKRQIPSWLELLKSYEERCLVDKAASTRHNELSIFGHHATPKRKRSFYPVHDISSGIPPEIQSSAEKIGG
jgi:hypothetical protein